MLNVKCCREGRCGQRGSAVTLRRRVVGAVFSLTESWRVLQRSQLVPEKEGCAEGIFERGSGVHEGVWLAAREGDGCEECGALDHVLHKRCGKKEVFL